MVFKKYFFTLFFCLLFVSINNVKAAFVEEGTAMQIARSFCLSNAEDSVSQKIQTAPVYAGSSTLLRSAGNNLPLFYVCQLQDSGFVLVSACDNVRPILAYSFQSSFDLEHMPDQVSNYLKYYQEAIQHAVNQNIPATTATEEAWTKLKSVPLEEEAQVVVEPLLESSWGQDYPYNNLCPYDETSQKRCLSGCVATAMAAIFDYWKYPVNGYGSNTYTPDGFDEISADFSATTYLYDSILLSYSGLFTDPQANAVASLIYHCGIGVEMQYGINSSGAYSLEYVTGTPSAEYALKNYFGYQSAVGKERSSYTDSAWIALIKNELYYGRPVLYGSSNYANTLAHSFVCDGYDSHDYFHFNWGWEGYYNGFFLLGNLNPGGFNFNYNQDAIIQLKPTHLSPSITTPFSKLYFAYPNDSIIRLTFTGRLLTDSIQVSTEAPFYLSTDSATWQTSLRTSLLGDDIIIGYRPSEEAIHTGALVFCSGLTSDTVSLSGNAIVCRPDTLPFAEDFEDSLSYCWHQEFIIGEQEWSCGNGGTINPPSAHSGSFNAVFKHQTRGNVTRLITPVLQLPSDEEIRMSFWHVQQRWNKDQDSLRIYCQNHPDSAWFLLKEYGENITIWTKDSLTLKNPSTQYRLAFEATDNYGYGIAIDDISIYVVEKQVVDTPKISVQKPDQITVKALPDNSVLVSWAENDTASTWEIAYGTAGFVIDSGIRISVTDNPYLIQHLGPDIYEIYLRSVIIPDSIVSEWCGPYRVNTRTIFVTQAGLGDGSSWENAFSDLQQALDSAAAQQPPAKIWVAYGIYHPSAKLEDDEDLRMKSFIIHKDIQLYGGFFGDEILPGQRQRKDINGDSIIHNWEFSYSTILSGDFYENDFIDYRTSIIKNNTENAYHVIYCKATGATIDGFTIKGGYANHISNGDHSYAAAIYADSCNITNCIIERNTATSSLSVPIYGGAIYQRAGIINNCLIRRNISHSGSASVYGGAVFNRRGKIGHSIFYDNIAYSVNNYAYGGSIYNEKTTTVSNCLIYNNTARSDASLSYGGGIYNHDDNTKVINSTVAHNQANEYSAIHSGTITNCIIEGIVGQGSYSSCLFCTQGIGNNTCLYASFDSIGIVLPSYFAGVSANYQNESALNGCDWTLTASSPAINIGTPDSTSTDSTDLAGNPRIYMDHPDLGAYEYQGMNRKVNGIHIPKDSLCLYLYQSDTLQVDITPANAHNRAYTLSHTDSTIVSISTSGIIQSMKVGKDTIIARSSDGGFTDTCFVWIYHMPMDSILLSYDSIYIGIGDSIDFDINIYPQNASETGYHLEYYGDSVITLSQAGHLHGLYEGTDTVILYSNDNIHSDTCIVHVERIRVQSIQISKDSMTSYITDTIFLKADVWPLNSTNTDIRWYTTDTTLARVDSLNGEIIMLKVGKASIVAVSVDGNYRDTCHLNIHQIIHVTGLRLNMDTLLLYKGGIAFLFATVFPDSASNRNVIWSSANADIINVNSQDGRIYGNKVGESFVIATSEDGKYSDSCLVKVILLTDLSENSSGEISLYPNPASRRVYVNGLMETDELLLYSLDGRVLFRMEHPSSTGIEIDLDVCSDGIYLLKIQREDRIFLRKIIKK